MIFIWIYHKKGCYNLIIKLISLVFFLFMKIF